MTMVHNTSNQRLKIKKVSIGPREMADVDASKSELSKHLFVRSGMLQVSGGEVSVAGGSGPVDGGGKKSAADTVKEIAEMENEDDLAEMLEDSRKTVREAAEKRLAELTEPEGGDGEGDGEGESNDE